MARKKTQKQGLNQEDLNEEKLDVDKEDEKKSPKRKKFFGFLIFSVILGCIISILFFNVLNIREKYLRPVLEKIPIVKNLLPKSEEDNFENMPKSELVSSLKTISLENEDFKNEIEELNKKIQELNIEINRLRQFEQMQLNFKTDKEEFDRIIAFNDTNAYANFYESIYPENAEKIYKEIVVQNQNDKKFKAYAQTFESMKKDAAAKVLEELIITDIDLVIKILNSLSTEKRAEILSNMQPENSAICIKLMSP